MSWGNGVKPNFPPAVRLGIILVLSPFILCPPLFAQPEKSPNILVILVDTLRADYLGTYGFNGDVSPTIDRLAAESIQFNRCVAPAPWTKPSVASLFTSLYPQTHHVTDHLGMKWDNTNSRYKSSVLADDALTLAEVLEESGYDTVGLVGNDFLIRRFGYGQGFDRYYEPRPHSDVFSATPLFLKTIRMLKKGQIREPFFIYLHLMDVHGPYQCEGKDFDILRNSVSLGEDVLLDQAERRRIPGELTKKTSWQKAEKSYHVKNWRTCYAAGIRKLDRRLAPFLAGLKKSGILKRTILILTSDHGEELYDHKGWAHSHTLYGELLHIPLLVRLPGGVAGGRKINETVSLMDVMPTLISYAHPKLELKELSGRNLKPIIEGEMPASPSWAFATATRHDPGMISIQNNRYKLIWDAPRGTPVLFDLNRDPLEKSDLAPLKPKVVRFFRGEVIRHLQALERRGGLTEQSTDLSGELLQRLQALGYMQ